MATIRRADVRDAATLAELAEATFRDAYAPHNAALDVDLHCARHYGALRWAEAQRADVVWLGVWERNPRAIAFYRKAGFEARGHKVFQVGNDPQRDLVMVQWVQSGNSR